MNTTNTSATKTDDREQNLIAGDQPSYDAADGQPQTAAKYPRETESLGIQVVLAERAAAEKQKEETEDKDIKAKENGKDGEVCRDCQ